MTEPIEPNKEKALLMNDCTEKSVTAARIG